MYQPYQAEEKPNNILPINSNLLALLVIISLNS